MENLILRGQELLSELPFLNADQLVALLAVDDLDHAVRDLGVPADREATAVKHIKALSELAAGGVQVWAELGEEAAVAQVEALRATMTEEAAVQLQTMVDLVVYGLGGGGGTEGEDRPQASNGDDRAEVNSMEHLILRGQELLSELPFLNADQLVALLAVDDLDHAVRDLGVPADREATAVKHIKALSELAAGGVQVWAELGEEAAVAQVEALRATMTEKAAVQLQTMVDLVVYGLGGGQNVKADGDRAKLGTEQGDIVDRDPDKASGSNDMDPDDEASGFDDRDPDDEATGFDFSTDPEDEARGVDGDELQSSKKVQESQPGLSDLHISKIFPGDEVGMVFEEGVVEHVEHLSEVLVQGAINHAIAMFSDTDSAKMVDMTADEEEDVGQFRRMDSDLLRRRQSKDFEVTAFSIVQSQFASIERREVAGESSVRDMIDELLDEFAQLEVVEIVHSEVRSRLDALGVPLSVARERLDDVVAQVEALEAAAEDADEEEDSAKVEGEREERRAELQIQHRACLVEFKAREKPAIAARQKLLSLWEFSTPAEREAVGVLQHRVRCRLEVARYTAAQSKASEAGQMLHPWIQAFHDQYRFRHRFEIAADRIQRAYKARLARKVYMEQVVVSIRDEIVEYIRLGITNSVAEEERRIHREWLIAEAIPSAQLLQACLRRKWSPSLEVLEHRFEVITKNAKLIHRLMVKVVRETRYFRAAVTTVCVENALFGESMDRATQRLYQTAMLQYLQACFRRKSVMRAKAGIVTTASVDLALTIAFNDSIENMWNRELDEMYVQPLIDFAMELLGVYHRRLLDRRAFFAHHALAVSCKTTFVRRQPREDFAEKLGAIFSIRNLFLCLWSTHQYEEKRRIIVRLQKRVRSNALVYATRKHRRLVAKLVAVAKCNLCRRFYHHMIRVGDHLVVELSRNETALRPPDPDTPPPSSPREEDNQAPLLKRRDNRGPKGGKLLKPPSRPTGKSRGLPGNVSVASSVAPSRGNASVASSIAPSRGFPGNVSVVSSVAPQSSTPSVASPKTVRGPQLGKSGLVGEGSRESVASSRVRVKFDSVATPARSQRASAESKELNSVANSRRLSVEGGGTHSRRTSVEGSMVLSRRPSHEGSVAPSLSRISSATLSEIETPLPLFKVRDDMSALAGLALKFIAHMAEEAERAAEEEAAAEARAEMTREEHIDEGLGAAAPGDLASPTPIPGRATQKRRESLGPVDSIPASAVAVADLASLGPDAAAHFASAGAGEDAEDARQSETDEDREKREREEEEALRFASNVARKFVSFCCGLFVETPEEERCVRWMASAESELAETCEDLEQGQFVMLMITNFVKHVEKQRWPLSTGELGFEAKKVAAILDFFMALRDPCMERTLSIHESKTENQETQDKMPEPPHVGQSLLNSLADVCQAVVRGSADKVEAEKDAGILQKISETARGSAPEASVMVAWLSERASELADLVKDVEVFTDLFNDSLWVSLWASLVDHCYTSLYIVPGNLFRDNEAEAFVDKCASTLSASFPAGEKPFKLYDNLWTIVPFPDDPDMYKYLYKPCIPKGFALNASGIRIPVEQVKEENTTSIFEAVFALSWAFGEETVARIVPSVSSDLPLGLFGAMTARRRRERVRMWCDIATERCLCSLLLHVVRCTEGVRMAAACWVLSVLCLLPGRAVTLNSLGAVSTLTTLVGAGDHLSTEAAGAAGLALQVLLMDDYVASRVSPDAALMIALVAKRSLIRPLQGAVVHSLKQIAKHNPPCNEALLALYWLPARLQTLVMEVTQGRTKMAADAALLVAALCVSDEATERLGSTAGIMDALTELLRSQDPLCVSAALEAFLSLSKVAGNGLRMMHVQGLHELILEVFNSDSLQFFTMTADLLCILVENPRFCTLTLQHVSMLSKLLRTVTSTDMQTATVSMRLIEKLAVSVEESWVLSRDAKELNRDRMEANIINAELMLQFGQNVHALSVISSMWHCPFPGVVEMAARTMRAVLRCCSEARSWLLKTKQPVQALVQGMLSESQIVQTNSLWSIYDLGVPGAPVLFKHRAYMELKVLLFTEKDPKVQVAILHALESFVLGLDRVATPDQDMVEEITSRLRSENEEEQISISSPTQHSRQEALLAGADAWERQEAAASVMAQMITQDYIDLSVHVHEGRYLPQSDSWGYCDPFVVLKLNGQEHKSSIERNTLSPKWDFKILFSISDKSEDMVVELWDWDNSGDEFLGHITMSCEKLEELGDDNRRVAIGRDLALRARQITAEAEEVASKEMAIGKEKEEEILAKGKEEAAKQREAMLEEARFLASHPKAEAKRINAETQLEIEKVMAAVAGQSRVQEYRASLECERLKKEAKLKAAEIQKVWQQKTAGMSSDDVEERVEAYRRLAESKEERALKTSEKEANDALMAHVRVATKHKKKAAQESQQLLDLRQGWYVPLDPDDKPLMGKKGIITGFDENGGLTGDLESAAASIQMSFEYIVKVNVDRVVWGQEWVVDRCIELLLMKGREHLWVSVLRILRALTEDIVDSRVAIGSKEGLLKLLATILETPDLYACYMEVCQLLQMLAKEPSNVIPIVHAPHLMKRVKNLRRWKGTALSDLATATANRIDKAAARIKKQEALERRNQRNTNAVEKKKAAKPQPYMQPTVSEASFASPFPAASVSPLSALASPVGSPVRTSRRGASRRPLVPASLAKTGTRDKSPTPAPRAAALPAPAPKESPLPATGSLSDELARFNALVASGTVQGQDEDENHDDDDDDDDEEEEVGDDDDEEEVDRTDPDAVEDDTEPDLKSLDMKEFIARRRRASMVYS